MSALIFRSFRLKPSTQKTKPHFLRSITMSSPTQTPASTSTPTNTKTALPPSPSPSPSLPRTQTETKTTARPPSKEPLLALPATAGEGITQLNVSTSEAVKLDHLGPMVVNTDGTISRISNWEGMSDIERRNTLRIIGKRNKVRLEGLREKEKVGEVGGMRGGDEGRG